MYDPQYNKPNRSFGQHEPTTEIGTTAMTTANGKDAESRGKNFISKFFDRIFRFDEQ
jgi:hypothetical protein